MRKLKLVLIVMLAGAVGLVFANMCLAKNKGNPRKGRYIYRKTCLGCHSKNDKVNGSGKVIQPSSKTQDEWKLTFENGRYKSVDCIGKWEMLSENDINDLYLFLVNHASDSPSPLTCSDS